MAISAPFQTRTTTDTTASMTSTPSRTRSGGDFGACMAQSPVRVSIREPLVEGIVTTPGSRTVDPIS